MQRGAIFNTVLYSLFITFSGHSNADTNASAIEYLQSMDMEVLAINQNERLSNLNLKTALTSEGLVYFDEAQDVFFVRTKPLVKAGSQFDFADRAFFDQYLAQLEGTVEAKSPNQKLVAYIFTDISCSWCQQLHGQIDEYLAKGITLKFIYFPRNGLDSLEARQMSAISQQSDPLSSLSHAFNGNYIEPRTVAGPVVSHFRAGVGMGIQRTPTVVVNGYSFEGYLSPEQVEAMFMQVK